MSLERIIISAIGGIFQGVAISILIRSQFKNYKLNNIIILFLLMCLYSTISLLFISNEFRFVSCIVVTSLILYLFLKIRDKKIVLYSFNSVIILAFSEIVISLLLVLIGINSDMIVNNIYYNLLANVLISLFAIFLIKVKFIKNLIFRIIERFNKNKKLIKYFYLFLVVLYMIVSKNGLEFVLKSNYYVNILFILGLVLIISIIIKNESKYERIEEENKQMLNYVTKYEKIITEQGKANHEFKNQLVVIRGYAQMKSSKIIEYIDSIVSDVNKTHSSYLISQLNKFPDGGIKGLLYYKLSIMDDEKINYDINIESGIKTKLNSLNTNMYKNITKILGVLLDNAIDASKQTKDKKVIISVIKEKSAVIFNICNTYKGEIDVTKIGSGYSTKGKSHGYGLKLVKDIISENKMFTIENNIDNDYYISKLRIKVSSKRKNKKD